jgi:orotidine-5'-phosphate decarboxylase
MFPSKIIVALDYDNVAECEKFINQLQPKSCGIKIGKSLFTQVGPKWVQQWVQQGFDVFLDLKFHDIPQQVYGAVKAAAELGVWMVNVHASGGFKMLQAAKQAVLDAKVPRKPLLIGVTILTSLNEQEIAQIGFKKNVNETVMNLAQLCFDVGLDGVVCSAQEASMLKKNLGDAFLAVTPGIRLPEGNTHDQQRIMTPVAAAEAGSDYLVIGRAITHAQEPMKVIESINEQLT